MAEREQSNLHQCGVLLLAHGAPQRLEDVPEFLLNVRDGRKLPDPVVQEIVHRYALIGGGSPLLKWTQVQAEALADRLGCPVFVGMRNWKPYISEAVGQMLGSGVRRAVAICLAPHNSRTSVGLYRRHLDEAVAKMAGEVALHFVENWHNHSLLIEAFADKVRAAVARAEAAGVPQIPVVLTAHSVPEKTVAGGDPYDRQVRETAERVARAADLVRWTFAYQSQGMTADPWLGPTVESQIDAIAARGGQHVLIAPIGFLCDHVEVLYDVDILFREYAQQRGLTLWRTESLNDSPLLIRALESLALEHLRLCTPA